MPRFYHGWTVVGATMIAYMIWVGSIFNAFGLFVLPVSEEFDLSRATMNTGLILINLGLALIGPFMGRLLDLTPIKRVMVSSAILAAIGFATLGLSNLLWLDVIVLALVLPAAYLGSATLTMTVLIARWFKAYRGRAMALSGVGITLGGVVVTPGIAFLIEAYGWRSALVITGIALMLILLVLSAIVRERPTETDIEVPSAAVLAADQTAEPKIEERSARVGLLLRSPELWTIGLGSALAVGVLQAIMVSLVPLGREAGLSMIQAASLISMTGAAATLGTLLLAVVADKVDRVLLLTGVFVIGALVNAALMFSEGYGQLLACAAALGIISGTVGPVSYALLADRLGAASFGTARGLTLPIIAVGGMTAIRFAGEVYDRTGSYVLVFAIFVVVQLIAAGLIFATRFVRPFIARVEESSLTAA